MPFRAMDIFLLLFGLGLLYVVNKLCDHANKTDSLLRQAKIKKD